MINEFYIQKEVLTSIKKSIKENNPKHALLQQFFEEEIYKNIKQLCNQEKQKQKKRADQYSYTEIKASKIKKIFEEKTIKEFFKQTIGKELTIKYLTIKKFKHKDYTIIHDEQKHTKQHKFYYLLTNTEKWPKNAGGQITMQIDNGKKHISFNPKNNVLIYIEQGKEDYDFIQYLNNKVEKNELIIIEGIIN